MKPFIENANEEESKVANLSVSGFSFAPRYIRDDGLAIYESSTSTLTKYFSENDIQIDKVTSNEQEAEIKENAYDLVLPTLVISATYISQNPELVNLSLNLISNYIYDFFKGIRGEKIVKCKILVKDGKSVKKISYKGAPEEFKEVANIIKEFKND